MPKLAMMINMKLPVGYQDIAEISRLAYGGQGVARTTEGLVVFINSALPGETVKFEIIKAKKRYREARIMEILTPSPFRIPAPCGYFGSCGGCSWQTLSYQGQLIAKRMEVEDSFKHLAGITKIEVLPVIGMRDPWHYRNRMDFSFADVSGKAELGLHMRQSFAEIIPINKCLIVNQLASSIIQAINTWAEKHSLSAYSPITRTGMIRTATMRFGINTNESMLNLVTTSEMANHHLLKDLADDLKLTSFWHSINDSFNDSSFENQELIAGVPVMRESLDGLMFNISPNSFFQTNTIMAEQLYKAAVVNIASYDDEIILDLFSGTGTIALRLAKGFFEVIGIEVVKQSVSDAWENATANSIENVRFIEAPVESLVNDQLMQDPRIRTAVINPPRAGINPKALKAISASNLRHIVYVSCNPTTLARDCVVLMNAGFRIKRVQPVDMFPHTYHIETICDLSR